MKNWKYTLFFSAAALAVSLCGADVKIPILEEKPSLIDGMLEEACWKNALRVTDFRNIREEKPLRERTEAMIFADRENLYVAFICHFNDRAAKEKEINSKAVFACDTAEIFVDPGDTGNYSHIGIAINGAYSYVNRQSPIKYAVQIFEDRWQVEAVIPFASMKIADGRYSEKWALNLARGSSEFSSWAPLDKGTFHDPENFFRTSSIKTDLPSLRKSQQEKRKGNFEITSDHILYNGKSSANIGIGLKFDTSLRKHKIRAELKNRKGETVFVHTLRPVFFSNELRIPLDHLPCDRYVLTAALLDPRDKILMEGKKTIWKIPPRSGKPRDVYTVKKHNIYKNGKFFFPLITWGGTPGWNDFKKSGLDKQKFDAAFDVRLNELRKLGFNTILSSNYMFQEGVEYAQTEKLFRKFFPADTWKRLPRYPYSFRETLEKCEKHGIALIPVLYSILSDPVPPDDNIDAWLKLALRFRDYENIMLWHTADETDAAIEKNLLLHRLHKELDPDRLTWLNVINAVAPNKDAGDILSTDPYPIPNQPLSMVAGHADRLDRIFSGSPGQGKWLWLQIFGGEGGWSRSPSGPELRAMSFLAMNHGVNGIAYFVYMTPEYRNGIRSMTPAGYEELARTNRRIGELAPMFCLGKKLLLKRTKEMDWAVIEYEGEIWVSAVNILNQEQKDVKLNVPGVGNVSAAALYENRNVEVRNGILSDSFVPHEVHIYRIRKETAK